MILFRFRRSRQPSTPLQRAAYCLVSLCIAAAALCLATLAVAQAPPLDPVRPSLDSDPLFSIDSPIGALEYRGGRGLHFGWTGLNVGGFTTFEFERAEGEPGELSIDGINLLLLLQPIEHIRGFAEIEIDDIFFWKTNSSSVESSPGAKAERLFLDITLDDPFTARFGKFQTPVGRWNLVPAEPFTWTATEPVVADTAFNEHTTGGAILGTLDPGTGALSYWIYGQFMDPLNPGNTPVPINRSVGTRLQFDQSFGGWSLGGSFLAAEKGNEWSYLAGLDALWQIGPLELTSEITLERGDLSDRALWDVYLQGVLEVWPEVLPQVYLIARYEHFNPRHFDRKANLADLGVTWTPMPWLRLKAGYRVSDRETEDVTRGLIVSISLVF